MLFCPSFTALTHKPTKKDNFKTVKFTSPVETEKALLKTANFRGTGTHCKAIVPLHSN